MAKFIKKPVIIEATQWFKHHDHDQVEPLYGTEEDFIISHMDNWKEFGKIETLEGTHFVTPGDWIITGVNGEYYPCKPDIFKKTYYTEDEYLAQQ